MKIPFRHQVTNYDCAPTSIINALSYLFNRKEIPPFIVHRIYMDCLDAESFRGTSGRAIQNLGFLLSQYKEQSFRRFALKSKTITGRQVHFRKSSRILRCLNSHGAVVLNLQMNHGEWHCVLGLRAEENWLHCYDPAPRSRKFAHTDAIKFITPTEPHGPNLIIRFDWLSKDLEKAQSLQERKYILGTEEERQCLLLNRADD